MKLKTGFQQTKTGFDNRPGFGHQARLSGAAFLLLFGVYFAGAARLQAQWGGCVGMSVASITTNTSSSCATFGQSVAVTVNFSNVGTTCYVNGHETTAQVEYVIGFGDSNWDSGGSIQSAHSVFYGGGVSVGCNGSNDMSGFWTTTTGNNSYGEESITLPSSTSFTISNLIVVAIDTCDYSSNADQIECSLSNCTTYYSIPFTAGSSACPTPCISKGSYAVTFEGVPQLSGNTGSVTLSESVTGTDPFLIVHASIGPYSGSHPTTITSLTYGGVALTAALQELDTTRGDFETWYLAAPASGAASVIAHTNYNSSSGVSMTLSAMCYDHVSQTGPIGAVTQVENGSASGQSVTLATTTSDSLIDSFCTDYSSDDVMTVGSSQNQIWEDNNANYDTPEEDYYSISGAAGSYAVTYSLSGSHSADIQSVELIPNCSGGPTNTPTKTTSPTPTQTLAATATPTPTPCVVFASAATIVSAVNTSSGSVTLSVPVTGTNPLLLAQIWIGPATSAAGETVISATYNGTALTRAVSVMDDTGNHGDLEIWYQKAPAAPVTANLIVTTGKTAGVTMILAGLCYDGVAQTSPIGATAAVSLQSENPLTANITTQDSDSLISTFCVMNTNMTITPGAAQTQVWTNINAATNAAEGDDLFSPTIGTYSVTETEGSPSHSGDMAMVELIPLCGGSSVPTNTFTNTATPTITNTPQNTATPTITNTPTITMTPTPLPCDWPTGATPSVNIYGGPPNGSPVYCYGSAISSLTANTVFGMSLTDVRDMADYYGSSGATVASGSTTVGANAITLTIPSNWKLAYFDGNLTYGPGNPAPYAQLGAPGTGQFGVLVVNGNLTLEAQSGTTLGSYYAGIVFVTGNLTIGAGCEIDGSVIMGKPYYNTVAGSAVPGDVVIEGTAGNYGIISYAPSIVSNAQLKVGTYKEDVSERRTTLGVPNL